MKSKKKKKLNLKNGLAVTGSALLFAMANINIALAASTGVAQVDKGLNVIKALSIGVCSIIGVVGLVKGGMTFASGISARDQSGIISGGLELAGGLIMGAIAAIITLMGF